jgi:hypothetical protein
MPLPPNPGIMNSPDPKKRVEVSKGIYRRSKEGGAFFLSLDEELSPP